MKHPSLGFWVFFPPHFFTHNSVHVLASVDFRFGSALVLFSIVFVEACHCLLLRMHACLCVLVGLNLVSEGRKFWGSSEHRFFFFFNLFSLIFLGIIFFAVLGSDQLELTSLKL